MVWLMMMCILTYFWFEQILFALGTFGQHKRFDLFGAEKRVAVRRLLLVQRRVAGGIGGFGKDTMPFGIGCFDQQLHRFATHLEVAVEAAHFEQRAVKLSELGAAGLEQQRVDILCRVMEDFASFLPAGQNAMRRVRLELAEYGPTGRVARPIHTPSLVRLQKVRIVHRSTAAHRVQAHALWSIVSYAWRSRQASSAKHEHVFRLADQMTQRG